MNNLIIKSLCVNDIPSLRTNDTLYVVDFRATGETINHKIYDMFKYENLSVWLQNNNVDGALYSSNSTNNQNNSIIAPVSDDPSISVINRLPKIPSSIKKLWMAVPHPDADTFSKLHKIELNYKYTDFIHLNDKLAQKKYLGKYTPNFTPIKTPQDIENAIKRKSGFAKSSIGAGGYKVIDISQNSQKLLSHATRILADNNSWYIEEAVIGTPQSVQIYKKEDGSNVLFGYAEQYMNSTNYIGARLLPLSTITDKLLAQLQDVNDLIAPLLSQYDGFYGIDFILKENGEISVLELNVRITATTIPTLLANGTGSHESVEYFEDINASDMQQNDIILTKLPNDASTDILRIKDSMQGHVGTNTFFQIVNCKTIPSHLEPEQCSKIRDAIIKSVSPVLNVQIENFWPYGWTVSFILSESHCVLSSWHLQSNIMVDVFCCSKIDIDRFTSDLEDIFNGQTKNIQIDERCTL